MHDTVEYEFFDKETDIESQVFFDKENETDLESQVFDDSDDNNSCDNFINYCNNYGKLYLTCITWISILLIMVMALGSEKRPSETSLDFLTSWLIAGGARNLQFLRGDWKISHRSAKLCHQLIQIIL